MSEYAGGDIASLTDAVQGLAGMVRTRARRAYRDADELRRLAAQLERAADLLAEAIDTERTRTHA